MNYGANTPPVIIPPPPTPIAVWRIISERKQDNFTTNNGTNLGSVLSHAPLGGLFRVSGYMNLTAITAGCIPTFSITYVDIHGATKTVDYPSTDLVNNIVIPVSIFRVGNWMPGFITAYVTIYGLVAPCTLDCGATIEYLGTT